MEKVVIDSCVFFHMLEANKIYQLEGKSSFDKYKNDMILKMETLKHKIYDTMGDEFLNKYFNSTTKFIELINTYNTYIRNKLGNVENEINSVKNSLVGEFKKKDGTIYKINASAIQKEIWRNQLIILEQTKEEYKKNIREFDKLSLEYKDNYQPYVCTILYDKTINGEVQFILVQDSYKEILNHIGNETLSIDTFKYFNRNDVELMFKNCDVYSADISPNQIIMSEDDIELLSQEYRTRDDDKGSCMDGDKNSLKVYGDSRIMAEASIAGYAFITLNEKDFITDKSKKLGNDFIRRHIQEVNRRNPKIAHDIMICSPQDYLAYLNFQKTKAVEC